MKWLLIFISLTVNDDVCNAPFPLLKYADEMFDTQQECEDAFKESAFYKSKIPQQIVGFCLGPIKPMMLSPKQLTDRNDQPKCK